MLSKKATCACALTSHSRYVPEALKWREKETPIDHMASRQSGELTLLRWKAKQSRSVLVCSTLTASETELKRIRRKFVDG